MSAEPTTIILPLDLGSANKYDQHVFPLAYHGGSNLNKGSLLLSATLEEMVKIKELGIDLSRNDEFIYNTRIKYEALAAKRAKLQNNEKTLNPFKAFSNYRTARVFHAASLTLYRETRETSEKMQRDTKLMQTVPSAEMHTVNDPAPAGADVVGIAINLAGPLDDDTIQTIFDATDTMASYALDPFVDNPFIPQLNDEDDMVTLADTASLLSRLDAVDEDTQTPGAPQPQTDTNPTSSQAINHIHIYHNSIVTSNSSVSGLTVNRGSRNSGASVSQ
ncbi:hypothetical protein JVT61DRAFT_2662 [Boletus reticuloceps]|uniref:Uncharacterized protein n=1 Tax=Boletus reticuloceps TaxID=495285 RepID=A0A8I2YP67_9AGAM|nr:hypothetical protein JVT61DRAFT_2662 [Boletus reticuloceps]